MLCGFLFILYWLAMTISAAPDDWTQPLHCRVKVSLALSAHLFLLFTLFPCMEAVWREVGGWEGSNPKYLK